MNLFIGCSSKEEIDDIYIQDGTRLIKKIALIPDVNLVYGAFNRSLMGVCYDEFRKASKKVVGVMTEFHKRETEYSDLFDKEIVVNTTTERFEKIYENSDMILFLPGGLGTYAEIFSAIEEMRIKNGKRIILFNDNYFYTPMIKELYHLHEIGFIDEVPSDYMIIESDREKIIELIEEETKKWKN